MIAKHIAEQRLTIEAVEEGLLERFKDEVLADLRKASGQEPALYYYTFQGRDYECDLIKIVATTQMERYFIATVPMRQTDKATKKEVEDAVALLARLNGHLGLKFEETAYCGEDFIHNRISVKVKILYALAQ